MAATEDPDKQWFKEVLNFVLLQGSFNYFALANPPFAKPTSTSDGRQTPPSLFALATNEVKKQLFLTAWAKATVPAHYPEVGGDVDEDHLEEAYAILEEDTDKIEARVRAIVTKGI